MMFRRPSPHLLEFVRPMLAVAVLATLPACADDAEDDVADDAEDDALGSFRLALTVSGERIDAVNIAIESENLNPMVRRDRVVDVSSSTRISALEHGLPAGSYRITLSSTLVDHPGATCTGSIGGINVVAGQITEVSNLVLVCTLDGGHVEQGGGIEIGADVEIEQGEDCGTLIEELSISSLHPIVGTSVSLHALPTAGVSVAWSAQAGTISPAGDTYTCPATPGVYELVATFTRNPECVEEVRQAIACQADANAECDGHGHLHDGVCHCDPGYEPNPNDSASCIAERECDGHGHLHGDVCHCDAGYENDPDDAGSCVEIDDHDHEPEGRLLVSDGATGAVVVVDLELGQAVASLEPQGSARVYPSSDGKRGFAVETSAGFVEGIDPGIDYVDNGGTLEPQTSDPALFANPVVTCSRPIHFVTGHDRAAAFCDGDGMLHVFDDRSPAETFSIDSYDSGRPHHGVGLVALDHIIVSAPNPDDEDDALPVGVRFLELDGTEDALFDTCPGLHGEASTHEHVCFGCSDGVMCVYAEADGTPASVKIDNPVDAPDGLRVGRIAASDASGVFLGNWGDDLASIDPEAGTLVPFAVGESYLGFAMSDDGAHVFVLTVAGQIRKFNATSGADMGSVDVIPPFVVEPGHSQLRPNFTVGPDYVYVVDPRDPEVQEVNAETLEVSDRTIALDPGSYHSVALVGLQSAWSEHDGHGHD